MMTQPTKHYSTLIAGGGIAGLITALELLEHGQTDIAIIDRDTPERLGGLARWAFGGMALCNTNEQKRSHVNDTAQTLLDDWLRFGEIDDNDLWPKLWANYYAQHNTEQVYQWLKSLGLSFMPAVNWVERGLYGEGNRLPRYHVLWGTGWQLVETIIKKLEPFIKSKKLTIFHQHKVVQPLLTNNNTVEIEVLNEINDETLFFTSQHFVVACGGINGSIENVKKHWHTSWGKPPEQMLNGANPISDGQLHQQIQKLGGNLTHLDDMWNYAAGIKHPQADFEGHGLSLIPCKSALWLNHKGERIGPMPLVTGFDTHELCKQVVQQEKPWTWHVLNKRIALKELAVSGSLHNPSIRDHKLFSFLKEILFGNHRLINQLTNESDDFITANSLEELVNKMNQITDDNYISTEQLVKTVNSFDQQLQKGARLENDDQLRRIRHARQWRPDKLRTCKPKPILTDGHGPLIAIKVQHISRKSLGGIQTNLQSQILTTEGEVMPRFYCVGEAAGFGGGGASGKRSLEGTFLSGCILTAKAAAKSILNNNND